MKSSRKRWIYFGLLLLLSVIGILIGLDIYVSHTINAYYFPK